MKTIRITYCGMDAEGSTVTEAKKNAARKLEDIATNWKPLVKLVETEGY
jgi:hypothetical protein